MPDTRTTVFSAVDSLLKDAIDSGKFLGLSFIAVNDQGNTIYSGAHGYRDFQHTAPMAIDTVGWVASMSKIMTSVAAMQVVEKGLVGLDDDLSSLVPEFRGIKIMSKFDQETGTATWEEPKDKITMRRLLSHSSGFAYDNWDDNLNAWVIAEGKDQEFTSGVWDAWVRPLAFNPGSSWLYGPSVDWAGRVVELVTGQTLEEYMAVNIWLPLGIENTTFHPEKRQSFPLMDIGWRLGGSDKPLTLGEGVLPIVVKDDMGGCGLYSTVEDYAKLLTALLVNDEKLLNKDTTEVLFEAQLSPESKTGLAAACAKGLVQCDIPRGTKFDHALGGLLVLEDIPGRRKKGSMCWDGMTNPNWMIDRTSGVTCVLFTQILPCPDMAAKDLWACLEQEVCQSR